MNILNLDPMLPSAFNRDVEARSNAAGLKDSETKHHNFRAKKEGCGRLGKGWTDMDSIQHFYQSACSVLEAKGRLRLCQFFCKSLGIITHQYPLPHARSFEKKLLVAPISMLWIRVESRIRILTPGSKDNQRKFRNLCFRGREPHSKEE